MKNFKPIILIGAAFVAMLAGCTINPQTGQPEIVSTVENEFTSVFDNPNPCSDNFRNIGIAVGAITGAVLGHAANGNRTGTLAGAAVGAGIGGLIGHSMDQRRCALYKIAQANHLKLASATITPEKLGVAGSRTVGLDVQIQNQNVIFERGTAIIIPRARFGLGQIAYQYTPHALIASLGSHPPRQAEVDAEHRKVLIVAHASETANPLRAARLSEERARAVAELFAAHGVPRYNIYYQGAGDTLPIASNATVLGRAQNRRVQIIDVPSEADLSRYLRLRSANPADFQAAAEAHSGTAAAQRTINNGFQPSAPQTSSTEPSKPSPSAPLWQQIKDKAKRLAWELHHSQAPPIVTAQANPPRRAQPPEPIKLSGAYDFGGRPLQGSGAPIDLGAPQMHSMFSFLRTANAEAPVEVGACTLDQPHIAESVRNLATERVLPVRDAVPGFYGAPWISEPHGNLVAILNAYVPKAAGLPVPEPRLEIYKDYSRYHQRVPSYARLVPVNVYRGSRETVYRMFIGGPIRCMDLIVPTDNAAGPAEIYYPNQGTTFLASSTFHIRQ